MQRDYLREQMREKVVKLFSIATAFFTLNRQNESIRAGSLGKTRSKASASESRAAVNFSSSSSFSSLVLDHSGRRRADEGEDEKEVRGRFRICDILGQRER